MFFWLLFFCWFTFAIRTGIILIHRVHLKCLFSSMNLFRFDFKNSTRRVIRWTGWIHLITIVACVWFWRKWFSIEVIRCRNGVKMSSCLIKLMMSFRLNFGFIFIYTDFLKEFKENSFFFKLLKVNQLFPRGVFSY